MGLRNRSCINFWYSNGKSSCHIFFFSFVLWQWFLKGPAGWFIVVCVSIKIWIHEVYVVVYREVSEILRTLRTVSFPTVTYYCCAGFYMLFYNIQYYFIIFTNVSASKVVKKNCFESRSIPLNIYTPSTRQTCSRQLLLLLWGLQWYYFYGFFCKILLQTSLA